MILSQLRLARTLQSRLTSQLVTITKKLTLWPMSNAGASLDSERDAVSTVLAPEGHTAPLRMNHSTLYFRMKKLGIVRQWS